MLKELLEFSKYEALGNDYIVVDPNLSDIECDENSVKILCDRNFGVGGDGILFGPYISPKGFGLRIFNPDGSECEKSGNGLRIFSRYLIDAGYISTKCFHVYLLKIDHSVEVESLNYSDTEIQINMGKCIFELDYTSESVTNMPLLENLEIDSLTLQICRVNIGNPHCVVLGSKVNSCFTNRIGPMLCKHETFPERSNVQFVEVIERNRIRIEIWERGAGYTLASGSSSCAAAAACFKLGLIDAKVEVVMPGGTLLVELLPNEEVLLTGSVCSVLTGSITNDLAVRLKKH